MNPILAEGKNEFKLFLTKIKEKLSELIFMFSIVSNIKFSFEIIPFSYGSSEKFFSNSFLYFF